MEVWGDIPGYEGRYQASTEGRIRSVDNHVRCGPGGKGLRLVRGRVLKPAPHKTGHLSVVLGKGNTKDVHPLILRTFVGPPAPGEEALHGDHTPSNNRLDNLRWGTRSENMAEEYATGRRVSLGRPGGTYCP